MDGTTGTAATAIGRIRTGTTVPMGTTARCVPTGAAKALLERIWEETGMVPALLRVMAHSPIVLDGYLSIQQRLDAGTLDTRMRYQIALAVSQANGSEYCVAAFSALGKAAGLSDEALRDARGANSPDRRTDAALKFARALEARPDGTTRRHLSTLRQAGFADNEIVEMVAHVMVVGLANALYHISDVAVDFPPVDLNEMNR